MLEAVFSKVFPLLMTAAALIALMLIAMVVGNVSGALIRKIFGIGGK